MTGLGSTRGLSVLVFAEQSGGTLSPFSLNAIGAANKLGGDVTALVTGPDAGPAAEELGKTEGVKRVIHANDAGFENAVAESTTQYLYDLQQKESFSHIIAAATSSPKSIFPRLAAKLDVSPISEVTDIHSENKFTRPVYAGNALATIESSDATKVMTIRSTSFDAAAVGSGSGAVEADSTAAPESSTKFVSREVAVSERPDLGSASTVISGGRAMKNGENFQLLYDLADLCGAAVGASRAAVDAGMVSNEMQVGQTGKIVAPQLYIAVGISGAIQHLAGMKDSKTIVAINKDPEAPIFQVSDYGLVADLFKAVPELTDKVKAGQ
uniref:Electron transfer flavoprotein subunit alpha n=1 Tax=Paramoeba aestuarina TaxID=180227 RepID=A0A7S4P694_9EUKA